MQAWIRNLGTCRLDVKGAIQAQQRKDLSTDARHRDGAVCSSAEEAVMALERRHGHARSIREDQL
jgi:hypothetical protein